MKGLYEIYSGDTILYVGESGDVYGRWLQHSEAMYEAKDTTLKAIEGGMKLDGLKDHSLYFHMAYLRITEQPLAYRLLLTAETKKSRLAHEADRIFICTKLGHNLFNKSRPKVSWAIYEGSLQEHKQYFANVTDNSILFVMLDGKTDRYQINSLLYNEPGVQDNWNEKTSRQFDKLIDEIKTRDEISKLTYEELVAERRALELQLGITP